MHTEPVCGRSAAGCGWHFATSSEDEGAGGEAAPVKGIEESKEEGEADKSKRKRSHKRGDKEHRKEKKAKRHKRGRQHEEESASEGDVEQQLERGRAAVRITREIVQQKPALKQELRQVQLSRDRLRTRMMQEPRYNTEYDKLACRSMGMATKEGYKGMHVRSQLLWRVDQGQAVQIMGIPDAALRQQLGELFAAMRLAKASKVCLCRLLARRLMAGAPSTRAQGTLLPEQRRSNPSQTGWK